MELNNKFMDDFVSNNKPINNNDNKEKLVKIKKEPKEEKDKKRNKKSSLPHHINNKKNRIPKKYVSKIPLPTEKITNRVDIHHNNPYNYNLNSNNRVITSSSSNLINNNVTNNNIQGNEENKKETIDYANLYNSYNLIKSLIEKANALNKEIGSDSDGSEQPLHIENKDTLSNDTLNFHESYVARKALHHWINFTENAKKWKKAQQHYERTLLKRGWEAFTCQTYFIRKEWKLDIRASLHYKHFILAKCFQGWRSFHKEARKEQIFLKKVDDFANKIIIKHAFNAWKDFHNSYSEQKKDIELADMQYNITLLFKIFHKWQLQKKKSLIRRRNEEIAINYNKYIIINKYFQTWHNQYIIFKNQQQYEQLSIEWYQIHMKQVLFDKWMDYHRMKKRRLLKKKLADKKKQIFVLRQYFKKWKNKYQTNVKRVNDEQFSQFIHKKRVLSKYFIQWNKKLKENHKERKLNQIADEYYNKILKKLVFNNYYKYTMLLCKTNQFCKNRIKRKYYKIWDQRYMERLAKKEESVLHPAIQYHRLRTLIHCFAQWKTHYSQSFKENEKIKKAKKHYKLTIERKIMEGFHQYSHQKSIKKRRQENAQSIYNNLLIIRTWNIWQNCYLEKVNEQKKIKKATEFYHMTLLKKIFRYYWTYNSEKKEYKNRKQMADEFRCKMIMKEHFMIWKMSFGEKQNRLNNLHYYLYTNNYKIISKYFILWEIKYTYKKNEKINNEKATTFNRDMIIKSYLTYWKHCYKNKMKKEKSIKKSKNLRKYHLLKTYLSQWILKSRKVQSKIQHLEEILYEKQLNTKIKIFDLWKKKAKSIKWNKMYEDLKINEIQKAMTIKKQKIILKAWINYYEEKKRYKMAYKFASQYYNRKVFSLSFNHWKLKYYNNNWVKSSDAIADEFYKKNIFKKYLEKWKGKENDWNAVYHHYEVQPIIYWSITLMKKVMEAWKVYSRQKKEMRRRISDAENWKRNNDIKQGIMTWIKVADNMYSNRLREYEISILPYQDISSREYYLMRKYFTRWHMKTLQKIISRKNKEEDTIFKVDLNNNKYSSLFPSILNIETSKKQRLLPKKPKFYFDQDKNDFVEYDINNNKNSDINNEEDKEEIKSKNKNQIDESDKYSPMTCKPYPMKNSILNDILNNKIDLNYKNVDTSPTINPPHDFSNYSKSNEFNELLEKFRKKYGIKKDKKSPNITASEESKMKEKDKHILKENKNLSNKISVSNNYDKENKSMKGRSYAYSSLNLIDLNDENKENYVYNCNVNHLNHPKIPSSKSDLLKSSNTKLNYKIATPKPLNNIPMNKFKFDNINSNEILHQSENINIDPFKKYSEISSNNSKYQEESLPLNTFLKNKIHTPTIKTNNSDSFTSPAISVFFKMHSISNFNIEDRNILKHQASSSIHSKTLDIYPQERKISRKILKYNRNTKTFSKIKMTKSMYHSNLWSLKIKQRIPESDNQYLRKNEKGYFYILEIIELEIHNAKNILEINRRSLENLDNLKKKFMKILQKAVHHLNSNSNTNSYTTTPTTSTTNTSTPINYHDYLSTDSSSQESIRNITSKIDEIDNEIAYIHTINKQQKYRLKQLNKQINYYLLNINTI